MNKIVKSIESLSSEDRYLLFNHDEKPDQIVQESLDIAESDFNDYLSNLEDYEDKLAKGEIKC